MTTAKILLIDDHAVVRAGIRNALTELPDVEIVAELSDSKGLLPALAQFQPDCLLIDLTMPEFDPIAVIGQVRATYPKLKILVVSAYDDDIYVKGLLGIGVDGYHLKDQPLSDLRLAVQRILNGEKWVTGRLVDQLVKGQNQPPPESDQLTIRQREIMQMLFHGNDNRTIALELGLSIKTVENHLTKIYKQINVYGRLQAVNYMMQHPEIIASVADSASAPQPLLFKKRDTQGHNAILVVDDNQRYRQQLIRIINNISANALVYEAENTEQAVSLAQNLKPTLAFVDVVLGDENGIHCLNKIHQLSPRSRIILFSAYPDSEFHRLGVKAGAIAFLDKKDLDSAALHQILGDLGLVEF